MIKLIVAHDPNRLIGNGSHMPWEVPGELQHFKEQTLGKTIVFGDVTFFGIGKPLPGRKTIILTLDKDLKYDHEDVTIVNDYMELVEKYKNSEKEIIICGGATIYRLFLPYVDEMMITEIKESFEGDVYFPEYSTDDFAKEVFNETEHYTVYKYTRKK